MKLLIDLLDTILTRGEKVLIFSQFVKMIEILAEVIERHYHVRPLVYHVRASMI